MLLPATASTLAREASSLSSNNSRHVNLRNREGPLRETPPQDCTPTRQHTPLFHPPPVNFPFLFSPSLLVCSSSFLTLLPNPFQAGEKENPNSSRLVSAPNPRDRIKRRRSRSRSRSPGGLRFGLEEVASVRPQGRVGNPESYLSPAQIRAGLVNRPNWGRDTSIPPRSPRLSPEFQGSRRLPAARVGDWVPAIGGKAGRGLRVRLGAERLRIWCLGCDSVPFGGCLVWWRGRTADF